MASPDSTEYLGRFNQEPAYSGSIFTESIGQRRSQECPFSQPSTAQTPPEIGGQELESFYHDEFPKLLSRFFEALGQLPADIPATLRNIAIPSKFFILCRSLEPVIRGAQLLTPESGCAIVWLRHAFNTCSQCVAPCEATPGCPRSCVYAIEDPGDKQAVFILLEYLFANGSNPCGSADSGFEFEGLHDDPLHQSLPVGHDSSVEALQGVHVSLSFGQEATGSTSAMPNDSPSEPASANKTPESISSPTKPRRNSGSWTCHMCQRCFTHPSNKNRHIRSIHKGTVSTCKICGRRYSRPDNLLVHARAKAHENASPSQVEQS